MSTPSREVRELAHRLQAARGAYADQPYAANVERCERLTKELEDAGWLLLSDGTLTQKSPPEIVSVTLTVREDKPADKLRTVRALLKFVEVSAEDGSGNLEEQTKRILTDPLVHVPAIVTRLATAEAILRRIEEVTR
jgi:hypothetical protein